MRTHSHARAERRRERWAAIVFRTAREAAVDISARRSRPGSHHRASGGSGHRNPTPGPACHCPSSARSWRNSVMRQEQREPTRRRRRRAEEHCVKRWRGWGGGFVVGVVFVRARGLGDISRLPIRRRQWTRSNYCCSYRLINLPLSRSLSLPNPPPPSPPSPPRHPPLTPAARVIFFLLAALRRGMEERKTDRVTARHTGNESEEGTRRGPSQIAVIRLV